MSRYTVVWDPDLESEYIEQWADADSTFRSLLTHVSDWLDVNLRDAPEKVGVDFDGTLKRVVVIPGTGTYIFEAAFTIVPDDRQVRVIGITFREATG
jgi:hypothetical protein